jgi:hypothetical protein
MSYAFEVVFLVFLKMKVRELKIKSAWVRDFK